MKRLRRGRHRLPFNPASRRLAEIAALLRANPLDASLIENHPDLLAEIGRCCRSRLETSLRGMTHGYSAADVVADMDAFLRGTVPRGVIEDIVDDVMEDKRAFIGKSQYVGTLLSLTEDARAEIGITTIESSDLPKAERKRLRKERRRQRDRARKAAARRGKGVLPRQAYLARSKSKARPWLAAGVSRASWYRQQKKAAAPETSVSAGESPDRPADASAATAR